MKFGLFLALLVLLASSDVFGQQGKRTKERKNRVKNLQNDSIDSPQTTLSTNENKFVDPAVDDTKTTTTLDDIPLSTTMTPDDIESVSEKPLRKLTDRKNTGEKTQPNKDNTDYPSEEHDGLDHESSTVVDKNQLNSESELDEDKLDHESSTVADKNQLDSESEVNEDKIDHENSTVADKNQLDSEPEVDEDKFDRENSTVVDKNQFNSEPELVEDTKDGKLRQSVCRKSLFFSVSHSFILG
jgi:hypothetical protein